MPRSAMLVPILVLGLVSTVHSQSSSRASARDVLERQMSAVEQTIARTGYRPVPGAIHFSYDEDLPNLESRLREPTWASRWS